MADLRTRFIEDYAGGLLNVARQELSSTGEVLAQDGFVQGVTLFVEDGRGVKSGLRLGDAVAECVDPTTETGILNVRSADRTYAKIRDLKAFATAVASAQGALTESVTESFTNLEGAFESLENDVQSYRTQLNELVDNVGLDVGNLTTRIASVETSVNTVNQNVTTLDGRILSLETYITDVENDGVGAGNKGDITVYSTGSGVEWLINSGSVGTDELADTEVTAGTYTSADITVDAKGRITAASSNNTAYNLAIAAMPKSGGTFTDSVHGPTANPGDNTDLLATTKFVQNAIQSFTTIGGLASTTTESKQLLSNESCAVVSDGVELTLPANPRIGDYVTVVVVGSTITNTLIVHSGGQLIMGINESLTIDRGDIGVTLRYFDSIGWRIV